MYKSSNLETIWICTVILWHCSFKSCKSKVNCHKMIEIGDLASIYSVESGDININEDVLDMKHANGYSGYSEAFSHSHRFNTYNFKTTVQQGETPCNIGDNSETSVDVQRQNDVELQEPQYKRNISAPIASQPNYFELNKKIYATEKRHKCDLCDFSSKRPAALKMHKLIHTGERPYKCDLCNFQASQKGTIKRHQLIHTGEKPYKCDVCDFSTTQAGNLKVYKLVHSGEKPFKCDLCRYSTTRSSHLRSHKLIHTGEKT